MLSFGCEVARSLVAAPGDLFRWGTAPVVHLVEYTLVVLQHVILTVRSCMVGLAQFALLSCILCSVVLQVSRTAETPLGVAWDNMVISVSGADVIFTVRNAQRESHFNLDSFGEVKFVTRDYLFPLSFGPHGLSTFVNMVAVVSGATPLALLSTSVDLVVMASHFQTYCGLEFILMLTLIYLFSWTTQKWNIWSPRMVLGGVGLGGHVSRSSLPKTMLGILFLLFLTPVNAVCPTCFGNVDGCDGSACPLINAVASNVTALAAATSVALSVSKVLPIKVRRVFTRNVLDVIHTLVKAPTHTAPFDPAGKPIAEIFKSVVKGLVGADAALIELQTQLLAATEETDITKISKIMDTIKTLTKAGSTAQDCSEAREGILVYLWAMTDQCITESDLAILASEESEGESKNKFKAKLTRPTSLTDFTRRLNIWLMILHATGVANVLMTTPFLEQVVYGELANGLDWKVVHELFLIYLREVDTTPKTDLGSVYNSGKQDTFIRKAHAHAKLYFRSTRGDPAGGLRQDDGKIYPWNCKCTPSAAKFCTSFNVKADHPARSIENGKCIFKHACDRFLVDAQGKRTGDKCGSTAHCRADCDNPNREQ